MLQIESAPKYFQYDLDGICYFEVYPNGEVVEAVSYTHLTLPTMAVV